MLLPYTHGMPLLFVDLDNTISDRVTSFRRWAENYLAERYGRVDPAMLTGMERIDGDGLRDKRLVADDLAELLELDADEHDQIVAVLRAGTLAELRPTPGHNEALDKAHRAGYLPFIVTNGVVAQQEGKVATLGLAGHVVGMVVSEGVGVRKPDPEIFRIAARQAGHTLAGAWMIGDSAEADIEGAAAAGIDSVWLHRGRTYPAGLARPSLVADSFIQAIDLVLANAED